MGIMNFAGPLGMAAGAVGGILKTVGAIGQAKETKRQMKEGRALASQQMSGFNKTYDDLLNLAQNQAVYKGDLSLYNKAEAEAKKQQTLAGVNPADQLYREQARLGTANYIENASRGAQSGSDLMSIAGIGAAQESQNMANININSANQMMSQKDRANQMMINSLTQTAAASARERGLEFESLLGKQQNVMGLTKEKGLGGIDMAYRNAQDDFARRAAHENVKSSIFSSVGDILGSVGSSLGQMSMMDKQMAMFKDMNSFSGGVMPSAGIKMPTLKAPNSWGPNSTPFYDPNK
jgi:hypothetical protein